MADDKSAKAAKLEQKARSKAEREEQNRIARERWRRRERNKRIFNFSIVGLICVAILIAIFQAMRPEPPSQHDALAKCLTQKGVIMYGTEWCSHCQEQKRLFGTSFRYVSFVNCDVNADACKLAGVEGFPTWIFPNGGNATGTQPLDVLASRAGCE